jgi:hypothetical protein
MTSSEVTQILPLNSSGDNLILRSFYFIGLNLKRYIHIAGHSVEVSPWYNYGRAKKGRVIAIWSI